VALFVRGLIWINGIGVPGAHPETMTRDGLLNSAAAVTLIASAAVLVMLLMLVVE
jgi:hypothetical protein